MYHNTYICEDFACLPQIVRIRGICPALEFFTVDFLSTDQQRLLHIKVFPEERRLVINSFLNDSWGEEAPSSDLDLAIGAPIDLVLLLTNSGVRGSFNDRVLEFYAWRAPISKTSAITIEGIDAALFRSGLWSESAREIEIAPSNPLDPEVAQSLIAEGEPPPAIIDRGVLVAVIEALEEHLQSVRAEIGNIRRLLGLDYAP
jgi:hypothetical protein